MVPSDNNSRNSQIDSDNLGIFGNQKSLKRNKVDELKSEKQNSQIDKLFSSTISKKQISLLVVPFVSSIIVFALVCYITNTALKAESNEFEAKF